jgi:hypothetical protein
LSAWRTQLHRRRTGDTESGQALLELALVTPILVLLIMAVFQFAFVYETQIGLQNAVREAARRAATAGTEDEPLDASEWSWVVDQLDGTAAPPVAGLLADNIQAYAVSRRTISGGFCTYLVGTETNYRVDIIVTYRHPVFFGPLSAGTDFLDGIPDGDWTITATTQMRVERPMTGLPPWCAGVTEPPTPEPPTPEPPTPEPPTPEPPTAEPPTPEPPTAEPPTPEPPTAEPPTPEPPTAEPPTPEPPTPEPPTPEPSP